LVEVICDTNFLIHLANKRIKNISTLDTEIGQLQFVVPEVAEKELQNLTNEPNKKLDAQKTLEFIKKLKKIPISGKFADNALISYVEKYGGIVATLDKELKNKIKNLGGSIISLSNDRIVLEPSKI
jgi:rRNA-processing protein FCF1